MRQIYVNLPVKDLERSRAFLGHLGFTHNPAFSDERTIAMAAEENIVFMLHTEPRFGEFINGAIADPAKGVEVLLCLSADSRQQVDDALAKALANGGRPWKPVMDLGFMYGCSFQDPDGHVWEVVYMSGQPE